MVKTPHTRHSKSSKEPVTIDLAPGEVSRVKAEAEAKEAAEAKGERATPATADTASTATRDADVGASSAKASAATEKSSEREPQSTGNKPDQTGKPEADRPAASSESASSASSSFGRKDEPVSPPPEAKRGSVLPGAIAGGIVALVVAGGLAYSGLLPSPSNPSSTAQPDTAGPAIAALEGELATLRQQIDALGSMGEGEAALAGRIEAAEQQGAAVASQLDALRGELAQAAGASGEAVDFSPVDDRLAALETALQEMRDGTVLQPALEQELVALREEIVAAREAQAAASTRLDTLEQALGQLNVRVEEAAESPSTAIIIAASSLKAAIDRGAPFTTELETYAALNPEAPELGELRGLAASGVPTRAQIAAESDSVANAMIAASRPVDPDAGIIDRLTASAMGLVQVRPVGMVEGEGVPETVARMDAAIQAGNYERALAEYETLPVEAKAAGEAFSAKVEARHAADRLVDQALAAALKN